MQSHHRTLRASLGCTLALATGCYAARAPVPAEDAFVRLDGGTDAFRFDLATLPDAGPPDSGPPDSFVPDAFAPDAWRPELGDDCSLGGTENALSFTGGGVPAGTRWRESTSEGWVTYVWMEAFDGMTPGQQIILETPTPLIFEAPYGTAFAPREYTETGFSSAGRSDRAGIWIVGPTGTVDCGHSPGILTIHEVSVVDGVLRRFRASFRQVCREVEPFVGCIRYTAP